jgi:hypothetical protein
MLKSIKEFLKEHADEYMEEDDTVSNHITSF